jgi:V8-like Glu-specific endopeptidase
MRTTIGHASAGVRATVQRVPLALALMGLICLTIPVRADDKQDERDQVISKLEEIQREHQERADSAKAALEQLKAGQSPRSAGPARQSGRARASGLGEGCKLTENKVVNGMSTFGYPAVGHLIRGDKIKRSHCSGTLIGCNLFLTAAHCFFQPSKDLNHKNYQVYFQHGGLFDVAKNGIYYPQDEIPGLKYDGDRGDIAIVKLAAPVTGIAPSPLITEKDGRPANKTCARIVGFGKTGGDNEDYGLKRDGSLRLGACDQDHPSKEYLCWKFEAPFGKEGENVNSCNVDSGGPLFVGMPMRVAGTTVAGRDKDGVGTCGKAKNAQGGQLTGDFSWDTNVLTYLPWIKQIAKNDLSTKACGALLPLEVDDGDAGAVPKDRFGARRVGAFTDASGQDERTYQIEVPEGVAELRIAMNGEDDNSDDANMTNDFDLYVFDGPLPGSGAPLCPDAKKRGQLAACILKDVKPGPKTLMVKRVAGKGSFQLTATYFPKKQ